MTPATKQQPRKPTPKQQLRPMIAQMHRLGTDLAEATLAGRTKEMASQERKIRQQTQRIRDLATKHELLDWTMQQISSK